VTGEVPTRSRIEAWHQAADGLSDAARDWRLGAEGLERSADVYARQVAAPGDTAWSGAGADSMVAIAHADRCDAYRRGEIARRMADIAARGADGLRWGQQLAVAAIADAEHDGFLVTEDLAVADHADRVARHHSARTHRRQIADCASRLQNEDDRLAAELGAGIADLASPAYPAGRRKDPLVETTDDAPVEPPTRASPADVNTWWQALTPQQRARLIADHRPELGNLNGIPAQARGEVNRAVMADDIHRVNNAAHPLGISEADLQNPDNAVFRNPGAYGLCADDITRYRNAKKTRAGLEYDRGQGNALRPALLWAYDPMAFGGRGKAAIAIGNPDRAHNTTVVVPGTGSSVTQGWLAGHDDALNVFDRSRLADSARSTAVIAWMGYDSPEGMSDRRLIEPSLARRGADLLAEDVNGLWATHDGKTPQHVTVIGHSYGATTVADAFAGRHMHANDAVLLGCPGADLARSAADFDLDGGRVYVGSASTDPISWVGQTDGVADEVLKNQLRQHGVVVPVEAGLGRDPAGQGFGAVRFHAEVAGSEHLNRHDHSHYYSPDGEALRAMTHIVTGHAERLASDGLVADGRRQPRFGAPSQLRLPGLPPIPIPHLDTPIPGSRAYIDPERNSRR
jgi:hypothetical protein